MPTVTGSRRLDVALFVLLLALIVATGCKRLRVYHRAPAEAAPR